MWPLNPLRLKRASALRASYVLTWTATVRKRQQRTGRIVYCAYYGGCTLGCNLEQGARDVFQVGGGLLHPAKLHLAEGRPGAQGPFGARSHFIVSRHAALVDLRKAFFRLR